MRRAIEIAAYVLLVTLACTSIAGWQLAHRPQTFEPQTFEQRWQTFEQRWPR